MANTQDYGAPLDDHLFQNGALAKKKVGQLPSIVQHRADRNDSPVPGRVLL